MGDEGAIVREGVDGWEGTGDSEALRTSTRNLVPIGDGLRRPLSAIRLEWVECVVSLLERVLEEKDDDFSDDGRKI